MDWSLQRQVQSKIMIWFVLILNNDKILLWLIQHLSHEKYIFKADLEAFLFQTNHNQIFLFVQNSTNCQCEKKFLYLKNNYKSAQEIPKILLWMYPTVFFWGKSETTVWGITDKPIYSSCTSQFIFLDHNKHFYYDLVQKCSASRKNESYLMLYMIRWMCVLHIVLKIKNQISSIILLDCKLWNVEHTKDFLNFKYNLSAFHVQTVTD